MRQPTIHQMREKKYHRGKVKEVEKLQYERNSKQLNFILNQINVIIYSYQHSMKKYLPWVFKILPT
jgi:hypothetical protein